MPAPVSTVLALVVAALLSAPPLVGQDAGQPPRPALTSASGLVCARGPAGAQVLWSEGAGLQLLRRDGTRLTLGAAGLPRFAADGRLVFVTGEEQGERLVSTRTWVLDPGARAPRPPRPGEGLPPWEPTPVADPGAAPRICVDPGHGGGDPGAIGNGLLEKDVTLDVALRLGQLLADDTADGSGGGAWEVLLTRTSDVFVSLLERVTLANAFGADSFVSIHANAFGDPAANGTETYAFAEGTTAALLRDAIHARMLEAWGLTDRGTKTANFYVLVNTAMPASLSEMGFVTNPGDALLLGDPSARQEMALAHLFALQEHHGFGVHEPGGGATGTLQGILFDASLGSGSPLAGATVALADGTATTTNGAGLFAFALPAGTYTLAGTAPGYAVGSASETVGTGVVWESFGLDPVTAPTLAASLAGTSLTLQVQGDPASPTWLLANLVPQLPLTAVGFKGLLWPAAAGLVLLPVGASGPTGQLTVGASLPPAPGFWLHVQALTGQGGAPRLSNGVAVPLP